MPSLFRSASLLLFIVLALHACTPEKAKETSSALEPPLLEGDELIIAIDAVAQASKREDAQALTALITYSKHPDFLIRVQALKWLTTDRFRTQKEVEAVFIRALSDEHWLVRSFAVKALAKLRTPQGTGALEKRLPLEDNPRVRSYIETVLRQPS